MNITNIKNKHFSQKLLIAIVIVLAVTGIQNSLFSSYASAEKVSGAALDKKAEEACSKDAQAKKYKDGCIIGYKQGYNDPKVLSMVVCKVPAPTMSNPGATQSILGCDRGIALGIRGNKDDSLGTVNLGDALKACKKYQSQRVKTNFNACTAAYAAAKKAGKTSAAKCAGANKDACETGAKAGKAQYDKDKDARDKEKKEEAKADGDAAEEMKKLKQEKDPALNCIDNRDKCDLVKKYVNPIINFLTALVGIAVTIGIISGGIRYASASDDPQKAGAAKKQISNAILALVTLLILYALVRWLTPNLL